MPTSAPPTPSAVATAESALCSPLEDESIAALFSPELLKTHYAQPRSGYDDGHPGIDLARWVRASGTPMQGESIQAVMKGSVAAVILDRPPYGNAIIIETPLTSLPTDWIAALDLPPVPAQAQTSASLSCPNLPAKLPPGQPTSLYLLYAHLENAPLVNPGAVVACGESIGVVGTTGNSINPHLHLEVRTGPGAVRFDSIAHYTTAASPSEIDNYCLWRISGEFQPIDPLKLFDLSR